MGKMAPGQRNLQQMCELPGNLTWISAFMLLHR